MAERYPSGFGLLLGVAEWRAGQPKEIEITGSTDDADFRTLRKIAGEEFLPHRVLVAGEDSGDLPLMYNRPSDRVLAYVCEAYMCAEPTRIRSACGRCFGSSNLSFRGRRSAAEESQPRDSG